MWAYIKEHFYSMVSIFFMHSTVEELNLCEVGIETCVGCWRHFASENVLEIVRGNFFCLRKNKVLGLPKTLIIQGNIFVLNHQTIVNLFAVMIQYEDITLDD